MAHLSSLASVLFRQMQDALVMLDEHGQVSLWSEGAEKLLGYTQDEALEKPFDEWLVQIAEPHEWARRLSHARTTGHTFEAPLSRRGEREPLLAVIQAFFLPAGLLLLIRDPQQNNQPEAARRSREEKVDTAAEALVHAFYDEIELNARVRLAEQKCRDAQDRYQLAIEATNDGIWDWNLETGKVYWNDRLYEILGLDPETFHPSPESYEKLIHPGDLPQYKTGLQEKLEYDKPFEAEHRVRHASGKYLFCHLKGKTLRDSKGKPSRMTGALADITEQKYAENALKESEDRFRSMADSSPALIVFGDRKLNGIYTNKAYQEFVGTNQTQKQWMDSIHPDDQGWFFTKAMEHMREAKPVSSEVRMRNHKGEYRWILLSGAPRFLGNGKFIGYTVVGLDITTRKRAEEALRISESRMRKIIDNANFGIFFCDLSGEILEANPAFLEMTGYTLDELLTQKIHWYELTPPDCLEEDRRQEEILLQSGFCGPYEKQFVAKNGQRVDILLAATILDEHSPNVIAYCLDITQRKQAENLLKESEERFRSMADSSPALIMLGDPMMETLYTNKAYQEFMGYELRGSQWMDHIHPDDREWYWKQARAHMGKAETFAQEARMRNAQGEYRWLLITGAPRVLGDGHLVGYTGIAVDITERKQAEDRLKESEERFRTMAELAPIMIVVADEQGNPIYANRTYLDFVGIELESSFLQHWQSYFHPDDLPAFLEQRDFALKNHTPFSVEFRVRRPDGQYRLLKNRAIPRFSATGEYIGLLDVLVDITEDKKAKQSLEESFQRERLSRRIFEIASQAFDKQEALSGIAEEIGQFFHADRCLLIRYEQQANPDQELAINLFGQYRSRSELPEFNFKETPVLVQNLLAQYLTSVDYSTEEGTLQVVNAPSWEDFWKDFQQKVHLNTQNEQALSEQLSLFQHVMHDQYGLRALLQVGIAYHGKTYGALLVGMCNGNRAWTAHEIELLQTLGSHIGSILFQLELYEQEKQARQDLKHSYDLINIIKEVQTHFISNEDIHKLFETPLKQLLEHTESEYGFIGKVVSNRNGEPCLKCNFITPIATETSDGQGEAIELDWDDLDNLFGQVVKTGQVVLSNDPAQDSQNRGLRLPEHFPLRSFLGMPCFKGQELVGMVGIANRPGGYDMQMADELQPFLQACANIITGYRHERMREQLTHDLRVSERALKIYASKLEHSNRELEQFAVIASHDLQAPLRKVSLFSDYLRTSMGENLTEESRDYLDRIQKATQKMQQLITDLLVLSRVTRKGLPFAPVDLGQIIREVLSDLEEPIRETQAVIEVGETMTIDADATQMQQVLQNLIGNALKFRKPGVPPRIRVVAHPLNPQTCQIMVQDNGIGFDEKYLDRIFEVFERLHGDAQYPGTGMGLAIVRKIVERHDGLITAQGRPGEGATFIITLPIRHN